MKPPDMTPLPCLAIGRLLGHKFRPRFDEKSVIDPGFSAAMTHATRIDNETITSAHNRERVYRLDICERCGLGSYHGEATRIKLKLAST